MSVATPPAAPLCLQVSFWERKHYFYADLPAGYQITQLAAPTVGTGALTFEVPLRERLLEAAGKLTEGAGSSSSSKPAGGALGTVAGSGDGTGAGAPPLSRKQKAKAAAEAAAAAAAAAVSASGSVAGAASSAALSALEAVATSLTVAAAAGGKAAAKGKRQPAAGAAAADASAMLLDDADDGFGLDGGDDGVASAAGAAGIAAGGNRGAAAGADPPTPSWVLTTGKRSRETVPVTARIERLQLEQDSGKSVHGLLASGTGSAGARGGGAAAASAGAAALPVDGSCVDLNRAGTALLEIVTAPDFRSADEAGAFVRALLVRRHACVRACILKRCPAHSA